MQKITMVIYEWYKFFTSYKMQGFGIGIVRKKIKKLYYLFSKNIAA